MLPKQHRLTQSRDFVRIRRFGRSSSSPLATLYVLPARSPDIRVGFSVSKRVGNATVRNRVKRTMREIVRHHLTEIRPGQDLVFIARPASAGVSYHQLTETMISLLRRANAARRAERTSNA